MTTIKYRLFNSATDQTMELKGTENGAKEYAQRLIKSGGWQSASINGVPVQAKDVKRNHAHIVPTLTALAYKAKELEKVALTRELTTQEMTDFGLLMTSFIQAVGLPKAEPQPIVLTTGQKVPELSHLAGFKEPEPTKQASGDTMPPPPANMETPELVPAKKGLFERKH